MSLPIEIKVELPPESQAVIRGLSSLPEEIPQAIKRGMDRGLEFVRGRIQTDKLSGKGPYPPGEHRLGEKSGKLRESIRTEPAVIQGNTVTGSIGLYQIYGYVHEYGMNIFAKTAQPMRFQIDGQWIAKHMVVEPPRATLRFGVTDQIPLIQQEIGAEVQKSLDNLGK